MNIYTSYFANHKELQRHGIKMIGITRFPPKWFNGLNLDILSPTKDLLMDFKNGKITKDVFATRYIQELEAIGKQQICDKLISLSYDCPIALCCYETSEDFCHRHILAEYLKDLMDIKEFLSLTNNALF